jgi:hypothetical protein
MKKIFPLVLIVVLFFSCTRSSPNNPSPTSSQWVFDGMARKGVTTFFTNSVDLISIDSLTNTANVFFPSKPTTNGTYTVTANPPAGGQCIVGMSDNSDSYTSTGVAGDKVTVTVSGGKVTASFSNIAVSDGYVTKMVSGTLVQQ